MQDFEPPDTPWRYRGVIMHHIRPWKHWNEILLRFFLLAPAAAGSEPAPGQLAGGLRVRKRPFSAALAIPGQLWLFFFFLVLNDASVGFGRFFLSRTPAVADRF
jgi:hypothetical protein